MYGGARRTRCKLRERTIRTAPAPLRPHWWQRKSALRKLWARRSSPVSRSSSSSSSNQRQVRGTAALAQAGRGLPAWEPWAATPALAVVAVAVACVLSMGCMAQCCHCPSWRSGTSGLLLSTLRD